MTVINTSLLGMASIHLDEAEGELRAGGMPKVADRVKEIKDNIDEFIKAIEEEEWNYLKRNLNIRISLKNV